MENDRLWKATLSQPVWGPRSLPSANYYSEEGRPRERTPCIHTADSTGMRCSSQLQNGYRGGGGGGARTGMWAECSDILDVGRKTKHFAIAENTQSLLIFQILNTVFSHALRSRLKLIYTSQCFALALEDTESLFLLSEQLTYFNQLTEEHRLCHWENWRRKPGSHWLRTKRAGAGAGPHGKNQPMKGENTKVPRNSE